MPAQPVSPREEEGHWSIEDGTVVQRPQAPVYRPDGPENLTYNNPYNLEIERVWFDGHVVYAVEQGELDLEFDDQRNPRNNTVAQEYQIVYAVELDDAGKLKGGQEPDRVPGQYNIYDSVPGMAKYSPLSRSSLLHIAFDNLTGAFASSRCGAKV